MKLPERSHLPDNLQIPGLYPRPRRRLPHLPLPLWFVIALVVVVAMVGIPGLALAHYTTSSSSFCLTCHATGETPDRSVPSKVHPGFDQVSCVDCHAKPGQVVYEGYVKGFQAEPDRINSNCLRCHSAMPDRTDQQGFKFNERNIPINHQAHLERGATCVTCHADVAHDLEVPQTNRPKMDSCFSCHPRTESCIKCHPGGIPPAAPARETVGRKPVPAAAPAAPAPPEAKATAATESQGTPSAEETKAPLKSNAATQTPVATATKVAGDIGATGQATGATATKAPVATKAAAPTAIPTATKAPAAAANTAEGKTLFTQTCAMCHGADGSGLPTANLSSKAFLDGLGASGLAQITAEGKGGMPPFGAAKGGPLTDDQIKSIVAYLMSAAK